MNKNYYIKTEQNLIDLGAKIAKKCKPGDIIYLQGEMGAGKTTLARGFLRQLGHQGVVKSPTYSLVESYAFGFLQVQHMDLYRLTHVEEFYHIGLSDYLNKEAICLIEWPEKAKKLLPIPSLRCSIEILPDGRQVRLI